MAFVDADPITLQGLCQCDFLHTSQFSQCPQSMQRFKVINPFLGIFMDVFG